MNFAQKVLTGSLTGFFGLAFTGVFAGVFTLTAFSVICIMLILLCYGASHI